jgi:hypothetical protein
MDKEAQNYRVVCTLEDIYGQIIIWLIVIVLTLVGTLGLWSGTRQIHALAMVGLTLVLSLPFLLFVFLTTLLCSTILSLRLWNQHKTLAHLQAEALNQPIKSLQKLVVNLLELTECVKTWWGEDTGYVKFLSGLSLYLLHSH